MGLGPALTSAVPVLISTHISAFDTKPDVARITSGDIADYFNQAPVFMKTRYLLLMNQNGDQYLLTLDELQDAPGKFDDWRIGFSYEPVKLPVGLKGGKINKPLPGKDRQCRHLSAQAATASVSRLELELGLELELELELGLGFPPRRRSRRARVFPADS